MDKDIIRAIGHLNMVLAEHSTKLWPEQIDDIRRAILVLQTLIK